MNTNDGGVYTKGSLECHSYIELQCAISDIEPGLILFASLRWLVSLLAADKLREHGKEKAGCLSVVKTKGRKTKVLKSWLNFFIFYFSSDIQLLSEKEGIYSDCGGGGGGVAGA